MMMDTDEARTSVRTAIAYTIVLYALTWTALVYGGRATSGPMFIVMVASQAFPGLVALVFCAISARRRERFRDLALNRWGGWRWYAFALLAPMVVIALSYAAAAVLGLVAFKSVAELGGAGTIFLRHTKGYIYMMVLGTLPWAFAEEIGWRGYLQPLLSRRMAAPIAAAITGLVWSVWHYPFILASNYYAAGSPFWNTILFTITVTAMGVVYGWTRTNSGSVWPAVLMHAASNAAWGIWQYEYATTDPNWVYFTGEAGIFNALLWIALAAWTWRRFKSSNTSRSN